MKKIKLYTLISLGMFSLNACSDDDSTQLDTEKPRIELITPQEDEEFHFGEEIMVEAELKDNIGLGAVKIEIHFAGDDHEHKTLSEEWFYTYAYNFEDAPTSYLLQKTIPIPEEINGLEIEEGHYHLGIYLIDNSGNEQEYFSEILIHEEH